VTLFADRARRAEPGFILDQQTSKTVAELVARLDGMPLAIELAAARVDALGVTQLLDRIDDRFVLLVDGDRLAEQRQRSLAAAVGWSYELLDDDEKWTFRALSAFPGPFTLDGAVAAAGPGAGLAVPRLVDRSLLIPPRWRGRTPGPASWSPATPATSPTRRRCCASVTTCSGSTPALTSTWSSPTRASAARAASSTTADRSGSTRSPSTGGACTTAPGPSCRC
jgi:hypothetical protein